MRQAAAGDAPWPCGHRCSRGIEGGRPGPGLMRAERYEAQVNTSHSDPVKTGSLYGFHKILEQLIPDDVWGTQHIIAQGNHIVIKVNDKVVTDIMEEKNTYTKGYCALQQHNKGSVV